MIIEELRNLFLDMKIKTNFTKLEITIPYKEYIEIEEAINNHIAPYKIKRFVGSTRTHDAKMESNAFTINGLNGLDITFAVDENIIPE